MASLFITRQNVPNFHEWKVNGGKEAIEKVRGLGAIKGAWLPDALNNQPAVRGFIKVPATSRASFLSGGGTGKPDGPVSPFEELIVDAEVGLGGENKLTGSAMMMCRVTLACPYDDFKVTFVESITNLYPGLCKAYLGKLPEAKGDERAYYVVFFDAASLTSVKLSHDISKPTAFRQLMDDGVIKEVEVVSKDDETDVLGYSDIKSEAPSPKVSIFDWAPDVVLAFDDNNKGGTHYKVL